MICPECRGVGASWNNSASVPCANCNGTGIAPTVECPHCHRMVRDLCVDEESLSNPDDLRCPVKCIDCWRRERSKPL